MTTASLGPGPATDLLQQLLGDVPDALIALTAGSADPAGPGVELALGSDVYTRQGLTWAGSAGRWHNVADAVWGTLPEGTEVGGYVVLNSVYTTLANPLAWVDFDVPVFAITDSALLIPAGSLVIQGFAVPE